MSCFIFNMFKINVLVKNEKKSRISSGPVVNWRVKSQSSKKRGASKLSQRQAMRTPFRPYLQFCMRPVFRPLYTLHIRIRRSRVKYMAILLSRKLGRLEGSPCLIWWCPLEQVCLLGQGSYIAFHVLASRRPPGHSAVGIGGADPANTGYSPNAVSMLDQRRRRWANIETALGECPAIAGETCHSLLRATCSLYECVPLVPHLVNIVAQKLETPGWFIWASQIHISSTPLPYGLPSLGTRDAHPGMDPVPIASLFLSLFHPVLVYYHGIEEGGNITW